MEIRAAIDLVIKRTLGASVDEVVVSVVRMFGLNRTGSALRHRIEGAMREMLRDAILVLRNGKLYHP